MLKVRFVAIGLMLMLMIGGTTYAQTTRATLPITTRATASHGESIPDIPQSKEFLSLATKAKRHGNVYIEGVALVSGENAKKIPPALRRIELKIWMKSPRVRIKFKSPDHQQRASDGKYSYLFRFDRQGKLVCQRKRITRQNLYQALKIAAIFVDAAKGYENLASAVRFRPAAGVDVSKYAREMKMGKLKWFDIVPTGKIIHPIARGWKPTVGISMHDGLVRVLRGEKKIGSKKVVVTYLFKVVRGGTVKDKDLKLPAVAAGASWIDADAGKPISTPSKMINYKTSD